MITHLTSEDTGGLGALELAHPAGTFSPSPASRVTVKAVGLHREELRGHGLDWGCGVGLLAIAAARAARVESVTGLDLESANVVVARENAERNGVAERTAFFRSDSVSPMTDRGRRHLSYLRGRLDFLLANPPHSPTSDGFDFRRMVLRDSQPLLRPGAIVLLQALSVYGPGRVEGLCTEPGGYEYGGIALRTGGVPLDYGRASIRAQHEVYCGAEADGVAPYEFLADASGTEVIDAREARGRVSAGLTVYARWEVHSFRRLG